MRRANVRCLVALGLVVSGCRDLTLQDPPPVLPGAVFGRVVVAVPGRAERQPARGAEVILLGSSLSTTTSDDGRFALTGVNQSVGKLLFRYVEGTHLRQRLISLEQIGAGPNRQVSLGDVLVAENATIRGRVLREELKASSSGHRGSVVFVPEGPFLTYSADDGSFEFTEIPEGDIELGFFRSGYRSVVLPSLLVRGGEQLTLRDVVLELETNAQPGRVTGSVELSPALPSAAGATATLSSDGFRQSARSAADGSFAFESVPAGLYAVEVSHPGYTSAIVFSVLVNPGNTTQLAPIVLGQGAAIDAGQPPEPPDASTPDAGTSDDGGTDGGIVDAGADAGTDAGLDAGGDSGIADAGAMDSGVCVQNADCPSPQWCDRGQCSPPCSAGSCAPGLFCELTTRTCVAPCAGGCVSGTVCDLNVNACRPLCDGSRPCAAGFVCNASTSLCEPECSTMRACARHFACQSGQCVAQGTCDTDLDCARSRLCTGGTCLTRLTAPLDAGALGVRFACTQTCDCRLDEQCTVDAGRCDVVAPPTVFYVPDGGGDGGLLNELASRARAGDVVALLADAGVALSVPLAVDGGVTLAGGYVECGPNRWVRDDTRTSFLSSSADEVLRLSGTAASPRESITLRNLEIESHARGGLTVATLDVSQVSDFVLERVSARLVNRGGVGNGFNFFRCQSCTNVRASSVSLLPSVNATSPFNLIRLINSSGLVDDTQLPDTQQDTPSAVWASGLNGPLRIVRTAAGVITTGALNGVVRVDSCGAFPLTVSDNVSRWPVGLGNAPVLFNVLSCSQVTVERNIADGRGQATSLASPTTAFLFENSQGTVRDNQVFFPTANNGIAVGFELRGPGLTVDFHDNTTDGGSTPSQSVALRVSYASLGSIDVHHNALGAHGAADVRGLDALSVAPFAGLWVHDNELRVDAPTNGTATGLYLTSTAGRFERNLVVVGNSGSTRGVVAAGSSTQLELSQNAIAVGAGVGGFGGASSLGLDLRGQGSQALIGNSIDVVPDPFQPGMSAAMVCDATMSGLAWSNIFGSGARSSSILIGTLGSGDCVAGTDFRNNYGWHAAATNTFASGDRSTLVFAADAGVFDSRGNVFAPRLSPYAPSGPFVLANASLCLDRGTSARPDAGVFATDLQGQPRVVGAAADIGCVEHP